MKILSLFDGMSCGQLALRQLGIHIETYYAAEIDKFAIKETATNFPNTVHLGDVENWREWGIPWQEIDLLIGGSPCQGFSSAGKGLAFDDPRSRLFFVYVEILQHLQQQNPNILFLLENVKMKGEYLDKISDLLGVAPIFINSAMLTAQNRQRYYWCNWSVSPITEQNTVLQDVIEDDYVADREKSYCIDANYYRGSNLKSYRNGRRQIVFHPDNPEKFRILTVRECCALQGVPLDHFKVSSRMQAYKMLGNGWTVPIIVHLFQSIFTNQPSTIKVTL